MPTPANGATVLALGDFLLDRAHGELRSADGELAGLRRQALDVLLVLAERAGHVVTKDELMQRVWPKVVVGEDSLAQAIAEIRRVLGDREHRLVRTVARRGYLLVPDAGRPAVDAPPDGPVDGRVDVPVDVPVVAPQQPAAPAPARVRRLEPHWWLLALGVIVALVAGVVLMFRAPDPARLAAQSLPSETPSRSLVVLPLEDESGSPDQRWFADALTADLTSELGRWAGVHVIGRGTAQRFHGKAVDPRDVARELGVRYVLRGTLRRNGDRVRLNVDFIDGETGAQRWTHQVDIERARLAESIDDIRGGIGRAMTVELGKAVGQRARSMRPEEVAADDLAMQGFAVLLRSLGAENFVEAGRLFDQAVAKDPSSIRALAGVSLVNSTSVSFGWRTDREATIARSSDALSRLESLDANGQLTLIARASLANANADWPGVLSVSHQLIERFPAEPTSHHHRCSALLRLGQFEESLLACERSIRISPQDSRVAVWRGLRAMDHFMLGRYRQSAEEVRHTVTANPKLPFYWLLLTASLHRDNRAAEAAQAFRDFRSRHPEFDVATIPAFWPATHPAFLAGRDRILASVQAIEAIKH